MEHPQKISVILPIIRELSAQRVINSLPIGVEVIAEKDTRHVGCIRMIHNLIRKTSNDIVVFIGDDCVARPDMIQSGLKKLKNFPGMVGIIGLKTFPGNQIAHWIFNKKILPLFKDGYLLSPAYHHCFSDSELYLIANKRGIWGCTQDIVIDHYHPINGYKWDEGYDQAYTGWLEKDANVYRKRTGKTPNTNLLACDVQTDISKVCCNKHSECFHTCHHSKPHLPEIVTTIGSRYNSFELDISCCPTNKCTEIGLCDMGFQVQCK